MKITTVVEMNKGNPGAFIKKEEKIKTILNIYFIILTQKII